MGALANITDRGLRYRANQAIPEHPKVCAFCGALPQHRALMVGHVDGHEDDNAPDNLSWTCRPCNNVAAVVLKNAGLGRRTRQFNPTRSGGAANVGEWAQAVGAIVPHKYSDRNLALRAGSTMDTSTAIAMIRATPHSARSRYAAQLGQRKAGRARARDAERWNPDKAKSDRDAKRLAQREETAKARAERARVLFEKGREILGYPPAKKGNPLFGSPKAARQPIVTPAVKQQAKLAGLRGVNFRDFLSFKGFDYLSAPSSLHDYYEAGVAQREKKAAIEGRRSAAREKAMSDRDAKRLAREAMAEARRIAKAEKRAGRPLAKRLPNEKALERAFSAGASSFEEAMGIAGWKGNQALFQNPGKFDRCVRDVQKKGGAANAYAVCTAAGTRRKVKGARINPAAAAAEVFEEFHGYVPGEIIEVSKKVHRHDWLAAAGELRSMVVTRLSAGTLYTVTLKRFNGAVLAFNEAKNQLFIEGGDQACDPNDFGITQAHELQTLGKVEKIGYFARKDHLGDEGGTATYEHGFRMTNEDGKHVVVEIAEYPDLIYSVPDEQLLFSGGSYFIRAEGIDL